MYELIQAKGSSYYIESPAKVGLVRLNDTEVCLIDSGSDKDAGRKVRQHLDANGWRLAAIYNTHSNADHIGGQPVPAKADRLPHLCPRYGAVHHLPHGAGALPAVRRLPPRRCGTSF